MTKLPQVHLWGAGWSTHVVGVDLERSTAPHWAVKANKYGNKGFLLWRNMYRVAHKFGKYVATCLVLFRI